jgi:rubrerythrin
MPKEGEMDISKALHELKKIEIKAQELYSHYRDLFHEDQEAADFFQVISEEEKSHADIIEYQIRLIRADKKSFSDVEFDVKPVNELIDQMNVQIRSTQPVSLESAIRFSISLESDAVESLYRSLMVESNPEVAELISKLGIEDKAHLGKLKAFAKSRGYFTAKQ